MSTRPPVYAHQGWYSSNPSNLNAVLDEWLAQARENVSQEFGDAVPPTRAIISPHAGLTYCGLTQAHGFATLNPQANRVIIIGPAHRRWRGVRGPAIVASEAEWASPLAVSPVDQTAVKMAVELGIEKGPSEVMLEEHCLEMELPFIHKLYGAVSIVPVLVRAPTAAVEALLQNLMADQQTVCVISSDFCHFGDRFDYVPPHSPAQTWSDTIRDLDLRGAKLAESRDAEGFDNYIEQTGNTICGRIPISAFLHVSPSIVKYGKILHYSQSNKAASPSQGSVSYCSIAFW